MQAAKKAEVQGNNGEHGVVVADPTSAVEGRGQKVRTMLKARLGDEIYSSWFKSLEFESFDGRVVKVSVPVKFVRNWIHEHYAEHLLHCSRSEFASAERVEVVWRQPGSRRSSARARPGRQKQRSRALRLQLRRSRRKPHSATSGSAFRPRRRSARQREDLKVRRSIRATRSTVSSSVPQTAWRTPARRRLPRR